MLLLKMAIKEFVMEFVFSFGLWQSLFLARIYAFTKKGSEGVFDRICGRVVWRSLFLVKL